MELEQIYSELNKLLKSEIGKTLDLKELNRIKAKSEKALIKELESLNYKHDVKVRLSKSKDSLIVDCNIQRI